jgi:hypothetical protein
MTDTNIQGERAWHVAPPLFRTYLRLEDALEAVHRAERFNTLERVLVKTHLLFEEGKLSRITVEYDTFDGASSEGVYTIDRIVVVP